MKIQRTLEEQRREFASRKFLATPMAGLIAWLLTGTSGLIFSDRISVWVLFISTGSIVYLALVISKFTGEHLLRKQDNEFDRLFLLTVAQAVLVYAIAIPFFIIDYTSLPLSIGVLTGLMWLPFSWIIKHRVGIFHAISRTILIVAAWYVFPRHRFIAIPFIIVFVYLITIVVLKKRKLK